MEHILSSTAVSITELKRNPSGIIASSEGATIVILNHNKPAAYLVPAETYEEMLELCDNAELAKIIKKRAGEKRIKVKLDDL